MIDENVFGAPAEFGKNRTLSPCKGLSCKRWRDHHLTRLRDCVAEEVPVALLYNGVPNVVMLTTPQDLEDFAIGFSLSEGILSHVNEVQSITVRKLGEGMEALLRIPGEVCACWLSGNAT